MSDPIRSISQNNYLLSNGGGGHEYSGANGVYVDNENEVIGLDTSASNAIETVIENSGAWGGAGLPISAGPGIKVALENGVLMISNDETVLFENSAGKECSANANIAFSEDPFNFEIIKIFGGRQPTTRKTIKSNEYLVDSAYTTIDFSTIIQGTGTDVIMYNSRGTLSSSGLHINSSGTIAKTIGTNIASNTTSPQSIVKVIGIGRKNI